MHPLLSLTLAFLATSMGAISAAEPPPDPAELSALRREFEKRTADAVRPVFTWYEGELGRLERTYTMRGNLDAALAIRDERERFRWNQPFTGGGGLRVALEESRWKFNGNPDLEIVFRKDGTIDCPAWNKEGWLHRWQVSGPNTVTYVPTRGPSHIGKQATLTFSSDGKSFVGVAPDGKPIATSPRVK